jgi:hypothetical protein
MFVDKAIIGFKGNTKEAITISNKSMLTSFKV